RLEDVDHSPSERASFIVQAVVEHRLAAAGLRLGKGDLATQLSQHLHHGDTGARIERVGQAGDEKRDFHHLHGNATPRFVPHIGPMRRPSGFFPASTSQAANLVELLYPLPSTGGTAMQRITRSLAAIGLATLV